MSNETKKPRTGLLRIALHPTFKKEISRPPKLASSKTKLLPSSTRSESNESESSPTGVARFLKKKRKRPDGQAKSTNNAGSSDLLEVQLDYDSSADKSMNNGHSDQLKMEISDLKRKFQTLLQINSKQTLEIELLQTRVLALEKKTAEHDKKFREVDEAFDKLDTLLNDDRSENESSSDDEDRSTAYMSAINNQASTSSRIVDPVEHPTDPTLVKLSTRGSLYVNKERLGAALRTSSYKAFVSKIFTALFTVEEVYRCTISGKANNEEERKEKGRRKRKFNSELLFEIYKAIECHYGDKVKDTEYKKEADDVIRHKLNYLDSFFYHLSKGGDFDNASIRKHHIIKLDLLHFRGLEEFKNDRSLFKQLDLKYFGETDESDDIDQLSYLSQSM